MHRDGILHVKQKPLNKLLFVWVWIQKPLNEFKKNGKCAQCNYSGRFIIENFREERN
jgi:hypothetical protein